MARNSEKAMTALARWRDLKLANEGKRRILFIIDQGACFWPIS